MNFSDNLKRLRKENNLSQEELAEKLGVSRQSVSKWESNSAYPEMDKIIQMSKLFNVGIDELLNKDIKEVQEEKQTKNNINKYIDDFLSFITKSIDMFLNMKLKNKCKFIIEEILIAFILLILFQLIGIVLGSIFNNAFGFLNYGIFEPIRNIFESIFYVLSISLSVVVMLHIYKTRYLDYYIIVDKEELENISNDEKKDELKKEINNMTEKRERVIIRDPEHSGYKFINGLLKILLILVKINVFFIFLGFCFSLVCLGISLILAFLVSKTGLLFMGLLLTILSSIVINVEVLNILFNFIISHKSKWKLLFITFIISLIVLGSGIGFCTIGFSKFDIKPDYTEISEKRIPMQDNLILHERYNNKHINFIESSNNDLKIEIKHSKDMTSNVELDDNFIYIYAYENEEKIMEILRDKLKSINDKKIIEYNDYEINVYATKENIEKLNNNYIKYIEDIEGEY